MTALAAGTAGRGSQKVHNQLAGAAAASPESRFLLFLDDDVWLHPGSVAALVAALEADPCALLTTGYPFDVPHPLAGFWALAPMVRLAGAQQPHH